jgi:uncharacterized membrane protein
VDPFVVALVAVSALLHVAWNVRLKTAGEPLRAATVGMLAATVGIVPAGVAAWWLTGRPALPVEGVALGLLSGVIEAGYFVLLSAAYRRGDLSVVYPIARGTAPLLAVAIGVGLFGERLGLPGSVGVVLLLAGFMALQQPWRALRRSGAGGGAAGAGAAGAGAAGPRARLDPAIAFALATGVTIATYTAVDRLGTRLIHPLPYAAILWVTTSITLALWVRFVAGGDVFAGGRSEIRSAAIGGWLTLVAYVLVLWALSVAPLSGVAPLRESATVFAAAWGSVRLGEAVTRRETWRRVGASVLIVGGAILLAIPGR